MWLITVFKWFGILFTISSLKLCFTLDVNISLGVWSSQSVWSYFFFLSPLAIALPLNTKCSLFLNVRKKRTNKFVDEFVLSAAWKIFFAQQNHTKCEEEKNDNNNIIGLPTRVAQAKCQVCGNHIFWNDNLFRLLQS